MSHPTDAAQKAIDVIAGGAILATLAGWLPPIAAALSILWYGWLLFDKIRKRFFGGTSADRRGR